MPFKIIRNDITKVKADAIVNTANPDVRIGAGVDYAIYRAAGARELLKARQQIGYLPAGEVGLTEAFGLDAKYILHASGPRWVDGKRQELSLLRKCYEKSLLMAFEKNCQSIAFPLLATGTYGFPKKLAIETAVEVFTHFLQEHEMEIILVVFEEETVGILDEVDLKNVKTIHHYIDDEAVSKTLAEEYRKPDLRFVREEKTSYTSLRGELAKFAEEPVAAEYYAESLEESLKSIYTNSFEEYLQKLINKKGLKNAEVYSIANISKQYFSKLLKGQVKPSKEKMLALAVGLKLNMDEAVDFLKAAGYAFSPISQTDLVVEFFIRRHDYSVIKIDIALFEYGLEPLSR